MPVPVYLMALGIFAMVTSEFLVGGLMPQIAEDLDVTIPQVGYLITAFALAMTIGGPLATMALLKLRPKTALLTLFAVFLAGNALAGLSTSYGVMVVARVITGAASSAFFGVSLSVVAQITKPEMRGRATGVAMQGLMVGTLLGLPISILVGEQWGWRAGFGAVGVIAVIAAIATAVAVPALDHSADTVDFAEEVRVFRSAKLWLALATSMLIIGATFAAFSYFTPILTEVTGFSRSMIPLLLLAYGAATVIGNVVVARLADAHAVRVLVTGLALNLVFLVVFALVVELKTPTVLAMLGVGFVGVTMNPAMISRVQQIANARPLLNTVHSSCITLGVVIGSWVGGLGINAFGLTAPLWVGAVLAVLALATLLPELRQLRSPRPVSVLSAVPAVERERV
ncbi:MFS transporter [Streptomyces sp. NPDC005955]|uniref:MFS transporter n=1 Tax=Streptomyces sp. NPDC005955 TaxID=3364738 RepID=UPI00368982C5